MLPKFGDFITYRGRSFIYHEMYEGDRWTQFHCIARACDPGWHLYDEPVEEYYLWSLMHDDYYRLPLDECRVTPQDNPETFIGIGI